MSIFFTYLPPVLVFCQNLFRVGEGTFVSFLLLGAVPLLGLLVFLFLLEGELASLFRLGQFL